MFGVFTIHSRDRTEELPVTQAIVNVGRAPDNDLTLPYATVSLHHARLLADAAGCGVMDLGSSNGTRLNGVEIPIKVAQSLREGDLVEIGPIQLRYHAAPEGAPARAAASAPSAAAPSPGRTVVLPPDLPARLIVSTPEWTREFPLKKDSVTLGREADNDIVIDAEAVSRHHAIMKRRGPSYLITDLGSTNGIDVAGEPVKEKLLAPGDHVCIGHSVTIEYRGAEDLAADMAAAVINGKTITREGDAFILEGHGPISAADIMEHDRQGTLVWTNDGTRAWVGANATGPRAPPATAPMTAPTTAPTTAAVTWTPNQAGAAPRRRATSKRLLPLVVVGLIVVVIAGVFVPRLIQSGGKLTPKQIYEKHAGSVVEIRAKQTGGGQALGTGFVASEDGYILTNAHVVSESGQAVSTVAVTFKGDGAQGMQVEGTVLGADESTDVALIKVDPSQTPALEPIPLGDSSAVTVGEEVVAIGNPLGLAFSLSSGVVSATDRELQSPNGATITGGIQTDAAINPGNSGGPLIDSTGHVIGINTQIATQGGGNEGIGFAVPINTAIRVMEQMKADALAQ